MVKKLFSIISILLVSASLFAATEYKSDLTKSVEIFGFLNEYCNVSITPINALSSTDTSGMPFSITDGSVSYKSTDIRLGREIASWSLSTNASDIKIYINAEPLYCEGEDPDTTTAFFNYYLTFRYSTGSATGLDGYIVAHSDKTNPVVIISPSTATASSFTGATSNCVEISNKEDGSSLPIVSINKDIRFMLDSAYSTEQFNNFPDGNYYAKVKIQVEGK